MSGRGTLGDLLSKAGVTVRDAPAPSPAAPAPAAPAGTDLASCGKIVLRRERKGRGGKTATIVAGLGLPAAALDALARDMRKALGCGGTVDADAIVLNGDVATRAQQWLASRGARRIVLGN